MNNKTQNIYISSRDFMFDEITHEANILYIWTQFKYHDYDNARER